MSWASPQSDLSLCFLSAKQNDACFVGLLYELKGLMGVKASDVVECSVHVHSFLSQPLPQSPPRTYGVLGSEYAGTLLSQRSQTRQWFFTNNFYHNPQYEGTLYITIQFLFLSLSLSHTYKGNKSFTTFIIFIQSFVYQHIKI